MENFLSNHYLTKNLITIDSNQNIMANKRINYKQSYKPAQVFNKSHSWKLPSV